MYSSKLTLLDVYNKHYEIFEHDYLKEFPNEIHADEFNNYGSSQSPIVSEVSDDYGNKISEYPDSKHYVQMIERDTVGGLLNPAYEGKSIDYTGTDLWLQKRRSRYAAIEGGISLRLKVNGNTTLRIW